MLSFTFFVKPYQLDHPIGGTLKPLFKPKVAVGKETSRKTRPYVKAIGMQVARTTSSFCHKF